MSSSKSKNIIIIILLLLDICILIAMLADLREERLAKNAEADALRLVMSENGIELDPELELDISAPVGCRIFRDSSSEQQTMKKLIGDCSVQDLGGNILFYSSENGQAVLRGDGQADIVFSGDLPDIGDADGRAVAAFMKKCGLSVDPDSEIIPEAGKGRDITLCCQLEGYRIYNARLSFSFAGDELSMINGSCLFTGPPSYDQERPMDAPTAMIRFLEIVKEDGYICGHVYSIDAGYFMKVSVSGECELSPVWCIGTDIGELYIDAVSGKIVSLAS